MKLKEIQTPTLPETTATLQAAFLTKHQKLPLVAPALQQIGFQLILTEAFDTDTLGAFSGEIPRRQSPLECVKTKAKLAAELTGLRFGIGSEGSFGGGPMPGILNWDDELLCLFDNQTGQYIVAHAAGAVPLSSIDTDQLHLIEAHVAHQDPQQGWICRFHSGISKGLVGFESIKTALIFAGLCEQHAAEKTTLREVIQLAPDLRAHLCPARQTYIRQAAKQLAEKLTALCPVCQSPDFWRKGSEKGLLCADCNFPTQRVKYYLKKCDCCGYTEQEATEESFADPMYCAFCNP